MKEKLKKYLIDICSSSNTISATNLLTEEQAADLFTLLQDWDLGDAIVFYLCNKPELIPNVKRELGSKGIINSVFEKMVFIEVYKLGYC